LDTHYISETLTDFTAPYIYCRYHRFERHLNIGKRPRIKTGPIRLISITDLQFSSFTDISKRNRIFEWFRPVVNSETVEKV